MKNLFSINKTQNKDAADFDLTPYHAATVSEAVRGKLRDAFSVMEEEAAPREPSEEEQVLRKKGNRYWLICIICLFAALTLFFVGTKTGILTAVPALHTVELGLLAVCIVFNVKAKRIGRRQTEAQNRALDFDFSEASKRLEAAAAEAARELGVPADALTVDVFPYHYKTDGDKTLRVGKKGKFDNLAVSVFVKDEKLCFATAHELIAVPLSEVTGQREYGEDFELDMWLKPEEPDSDRYRDYGIRKSGFLAHKGHGYFGLLIGTDAYEVLIPCYDFGEVQTLLHQNGVF